MKKMIVILLTIGVVYGFTNMIWVHGLVSACEKQNIVRVNEYLKYRCIFQINGRDSFKLPTALYENKTALIASCENQNYQLIHLLLEAGADPNKGCFGRYGWDVPLHTAIVNAEANRITDIVKCLLEAGANPNQEDDDGCNALLSIASQTVNVYDNDNTFVGIDEDLATSFTESYQIIYERSNDKEPTDNNGRTPLHWAAYMNNGPLVDLLITKYDADLGAKDNEGKTPLQFCNEEEQTALEEEYREVMMDKLQKYMN